jgi:hypothetical protein
VKMQVLLLNISGFALESAIPGSTIDKHVSSDNPDSRATRQYVQ